jgi:hypothetical protein
MRLLLGQLMLALLAGSGCFERAYCGMAWETETSWVQPAVFDAFPTEGSTPEHYSAWWTYENEYEPEGGPVKGQPPPTPPPGFDPGNVTRKDAMGETGTWRTRLTAKPDGNVSWQASAYESKGQGWTRERLTDTFADLGLPAPTAAAADFSWRHVC